MRNADTTGGPSAARPGLASYIERGYIPVEDAVAVKGGHAGEQVSRTLEYAYNDAVAAGLAGLGAGHAGDVARLQQRSRHYANVYDQSSGFFRGRSSDGTFPREPLDPNGRQPWLTEGSPAHWLFAGTPHDIGGLIKLVGGGAALAARLDAYFALTTSASTTPRGARSVRMAIDDGESLHWHGNEPGHHVPFLYAYTGQAWKTQAGMSGDFPRGCR